MHRGLSFGKEASFTIPSSLAFDLPSIPISMPTPSLSSSLFKAGLFPPSRLYHQPQPPFLLGRKRHRYQQPKSHLGLARLDAVAPDVALIRCFASRRLFVTLSSGTGFCGLARPAGARAWWTRAGSGRAPLGRGSLGARNWVTVGPNRGGGGEKDSVQAVAPSDPEVMETNGSHPLLQKQEKQCSDPPTTLITLPTVLTLGRVAAVPLLVCSYYMNGWWATTATTSIFVAAAITDWLDGYIARKKRLGTAFGAFLDPVADKLMVATTLILLCTTPLEFASYGKVPWLLAIPAIAIIGREITMSAVREWAASQDSKVLEAVAVNKLGKWKTATQMIALTILLATRDSSLTGVDVVLASGVVLLYISAGLAVASLVVYMRNIWKFMLM